MTALFDLPRTTKNKGKKRSAPDPRPRLNRIPRPTTCHTCKKNILESQPSISDIVTVDPYTLTPLTVQAHLLIGRRIYRAEIGIAWAPGELAITYPEDLEYFDHWKYYWLPQHQCHHPLTGGYPLASKPPNTPPTNPPY